MANSWLIFTDLDGTLLDANTYAFNEALPAIQFLKTKHIPVIPCTSKTHLEVLRIRGQLALADPFIVENGSAVFIPQGYFPQPVGETLMEGHEVLILGRKHSEILQCFEKMRQNFKLKARGFSEMSAREIRDLTQLTLDEARLAKQRFFSEPFVCEQDLLGNQALMEFLKEHNCRLLRGNRFYHLLGNSDKGKAVKTLHRLYEKIQKRKFRTLGLGDSKNDIDLLSAVDQPVLIKKPDYSYGIDLDLKNIYKTRHIGPAGWREAIEYFIKQ